MGKPNCVPLNWLIGKPKNTWLTDSWWKNKTCEKSIHLYQHVQFRWNLKYTVEKNRTLKLGCKFREKLCIVPCLYSAGVNPNPTWYSWRYTPSHVCDLIISIKQVRFPNKSQNLFIKCYMINKIMSNLFSQVPWKRDVVRGERNWSPRISPLRWRLSMEYNMIFYLIANTS